MKNDITLEVRMRSELTQVEINEIITLCSYAYYEDYAPFMNSLDDSTHILARKNDKLVSHALWITRWLQIGNDPLLRTAYVEGVATDDSYRGLGYATAVMTRLAEEIREFDIGGLSPAKTSLYIRLGWEYWKGPLFHRKQDKRMRDPEDEQMMILRLPKTPAIDLTQPISVEWREGEIW
jgi:aminoglycoside 2'-N-acetyltransferase I